VIPWRPRLHLPALILWGRNDFALSPVNAELSLELCEHGRLEWIDAGHWVQHEEPQWINTRLIDFFNELA
jgi:pimeloyl-ACP methyl ester carboxylesterase